MGLVLDANLAIAQDAETTFPPRIGAVNLYRATGATVTVSAEDTANDGHKENAYAEGFTHDFWKPGASGVQWIRVSLPSAEKADYIGIAAHDLNTTGGTFKAQYSTDGGTSWNDAHTAITPATSEPIMVLFTEVEAADWRLHVDATSAFRIGAVHIGLALQLAGPLEGPWDPPHLNQRVRYINDLTEGGQFVGRSIVSRGARFTLQIPALDTAWIRDTWEPVVRLMEQYPFFFAARDLAASGGREQEVVYAWTREQPRGRYADHVNGAVRLSCQAIVD